MFQATIATSDINNLVSPEHLCVPVGFDNRCNMGGITTDAR
jgi:hypothetical protein